MEVSDHFEQVQQWKEMLLEYRKKDFKKVLEMCPVLEGYAYEMQDKELLGFVYFYRGEAYYVLNEVEDMFKCMAQSVPYLNDTGQWELLTRAYNMMAITSINRGHAPVALDYYLTALKYAREHGVETVICSIHINLGYLYMQNNLYEDAKSHFFAAYEMCSTNVQGEQQIGRLSMIYTNLVTCYMLCGDMQQAGIYMERLREECSSHFNNMDHVYVGCMAARYYHMCADLEKRDKKIQDILQYLDKQLPILDLFDDLYSLCELTLEIKDFEAFTRVIKAVEPVVLHTGMINLQRKLLEIQIRYYELIQDQKSYLEAVSRFYKLVTSMEKESHTMLANMMQVRTALEHAQESRHQMEEMNAILMQKSQTDPLSGLSNRYCMMDVFEQMLEACRREQRPLGVVMLDIDYFKEYNDNYGHHSGDECIRAVAGIIRSMQNERIFALRYGGDEFVMLLHGFSRQEVMKVVQELREKITKLHIEHAYSKAASFVTVTQGVCLGIPDNSDACLDFLHAADENLYKVKRQQRNHIGIGDVQRSYFFIV